MQDSSLSDLSKYRIVCARYQKPVDFLTHIPIAAEVLTKGEDGIPNIANEATSYLQYIIRNYNDLAEATVFVHDEDESWHHTGKISERIYDWIHTFEAEGENYYEFNNMCICKGDLNDNQPVFRQFWDQCLRPYLGEFVSAEPHKGKCCAQFIVGRNMIVRHPIELYQGMYDWLIKHTSGEGIGSEKDPYSGYFTGRYCEWSWRFIFSPLSIIRN